jgi:hypothetical protein
VSLDPAAASAARRTRPVVRWAAPLALTALAALSGCNEDALVACASDADCAAAGLLCHGAVGLCATSCADFSTEPPAEGGLSDAAQFCRTQMGTDEDDIGGVIWACAADSGRCFRQNACLENADCEGGLVCYPPASGEGPGECEPSCASDPSICPAGTVCDMATGVCGAGCEGNPDQCGDGQVCQVGFGMGAPCTQPCNEGFDCTMGGQFEFRCDMETGLCQPGCLEDTDCRSGRVCMVVATREMYQCFDPCPATPCSVFNGQGMTFTCNEADGHCVAQ